LFNLAAGVQQLVGEFYRAMLAAAGKQHAEEMTRSNRQHAQGVIPASWMRAKLFNSCLANIGTQWDLILSDQSS
jgi:DNA-binding GntR family transcriptional regulator